MENVILCIFVFVSFYYTQMGTRIADLPGLLFYDCQLFSRPSR